MNDKQNGKSPIVTSKAFLAAGPTLHYSHSHVHAFWLATLLVYTAACLFWSKILTGSFLPFDSQLATSIQHYGLGRFLISGISIFEYPWQILVLALLMAIIAITPVLVSQLLSFIYCVPFILAAFFVADLPAFAGCLLISSLAAACRPLRFRSRFIALALCTVPQLLYWGYFGPASGIEPVKWGFSFTPWAMAWLLCLGIAGLVLGIGHFTRYRPGLIFASTLVVLAAAFVIVDLRIGFDELDYQLYVARNNPEQISEFQDRSITQALNDTTSSPAIMRYLGDFFYPTDPNLLRAELKREIQDKLAQDRWPGWFIVPDELNFQDKRRWLLSQYDLFITRRPKSRRMPIALYFWAMLTEYAPDLNLLSQRETLHFYSDYPSVGARNTWYRLYSEFGDSPEAIEARWRIAMHWAGQGRFDQAETRTTEAIAAIEEQLKKTTNQQTSADSIFSPFHPSPDTAITPTKLADLQRRLNQLRILIGRENRAGDGGAGARLARFAVLDSRARDYPDQLAMLLERLGPNDPLRDNILLAQAKLVADERLRADKLADLHKRMPKTDGGMQALYDLALFRIHLWRQQQADTNPEQKKRLLTDARAALTTFLTLYPNSFYADQVKKNLADLPATE